MSKNEARRQKQLAKKKAKRDEKRSQLAKQNSDNPIIRLAGADAWPIVAALVPESLWAQGIGQLVLTRRCPDGRLACAIFLVDVFCMGVKNALWRLLSDWEYDRMMRKQTHNNPYLSVAPEYFAKLVYGAVDFAKAIGIQPHADYPHARMLLAGIDASRCTETFPYGDKDGKPHYITGPYESPERIKVIMHRVRLAGGQISLRLKDFERDLPALGLEVANEEQEAVETSEPEA